MYKLLALLAVLGFGAAHAGSGDSADADPASSSTDAAQGHELQIDHESDDPMGDEGMSGGGDGSGEDE